ncbi:hypothetical protein Efla_006106 [Eimeria flavescens]
MNQEGGGEQSVASLLPELGACGLDFGLGLAAARACTTSLLPVGLAALSDPNNMQSEQQQQQQQPLPLLHAAGGAPQTLAPTAVPAEQLSSVGAANPGPPLLAAPAPPVEIKLFVGGVPPTLEEEPLRVLFTLFGPVLDVVVLRDRVSNRHKGCAFVRMKSLADADRAIRELSDQSLNPPLETLYIRYAAGEAERLGFPHSGAGGAKPGVDEAKLFVGSLPKDVKEHDVRALFERYGHVQEVFLLRNNTAGSRSRNGPSGSAFVRFAYKEQALYAIACLGGKHVIPNTTRPLEVRFAAAKRRNSESRDHLNSSLRMGEEAPGPLAASAAPWHEAEVWADYLTGARQADAFNFSTGTTPADMPVHPPVSAVTRAAAARGLEAPPLDAALLPQGRSIGLDDDPASHQGAFARLVENLEFQGDASDGVLGDSRDSLKGRRVRDKKAHGPPGANVFIFHIPNEWTSGDLLRHFSPFGPLISARIAVDRHTRRNRGFAFVNYQDVNSAIVAVGTMDGFQVNGKRLKVRIKKGEEGYAEALMLGKQQPSLDQSGNRRRPPVRLSGAPTTQEEPQDFVASSLLEIAKSGGGNSLLPLFACFLLSTVVPQLEASVRHRREEELLLRPPREMGEQQHLHGLQHRLHHTSQLHQQLGYPQQPDRDQRVSLMVDAVDSGARQAPESVAGVLPEVEELSSLLTRRLHLHDLVPSVGLLGLPPDQDVGPLSHTASRLSP